MKIAVPVNSMNEIDGHFGHCEYYDVFTISGDNEISNFIDNYYLISAPSSFLSSSFPFFASGAGKFSAIIRLIFATFLNNRTLVIIKAVKTAISMTSGLVPKLLSIK